MQEQIVTCQLDNLMCLPIMHQHAYSELLYKSDVGLSSLHSGHKIHNFPGLLLGYLGYAKPILGCVNAGNDHKEIVSNAGLVWLLKVAICRA